jgi:uncharacterized membrane protein (DUF2068 family)
MNTIVTTIDQSGAPMPPAIIGFRVGGQTLGVADTLRHVAANITVKGLWKVGAATAIAGVATAIQEIQVTRGQLQGQVDLLTRQRNEAVARAAYVEDQLHKAKASKKATRWTPAEIATLTELRAAGMAYGKIAEALGTCRTAAAVGAKARSLAAKADAPAKAAKPATKARKATGKGRAV